MLGFDMNVIEKGIRGIFGREFVTRQRKAKYPYFCTIVNSDKKTETYNALSTLPTLTEMKDERILAGFSEYTYSVTNKVYATGVKVPRTLFEFDQTGQLRTLVQSLGARVANFPDKLVYTLMGLSYHDTLGKCYDDSKFVEGKTGGGDDTGHDLGNGVAQYNGFLGSLTDTLLAATSRTDRDNAIAAFQQDLRIAKAMMLEITDDRGEPWHDDADPEDLIILCHPRAEFFVRTALEGAIINDTSNITVRSVGKIITTPRTEPFVANDDETFHYGTWWLFKINTPIKPMIFQRFGPKQSFPDTIPESDHEMLQALSSVEVQTIMRTGRDISETTFFDDDFLFGARVLYSAGFGMWQNAIKVDGDT